MHVKVIQSKGRHFMLLYLQDFVLYFILFEVLYALFIYSENSLYVKKILIILKFFGYETLPLKQ